MDTPWDDAHDAETAWKDVREAEWTKMSSEFYNVGYREGITAGKEASVQEGFDAGFADVGAPLGRDLGLIRGQSSALLGFLISAPPAVLGVPDDEKELLMQEAREISTQLGNIRYSDIEPRDLEAEQHAREHLEAEGQEMEVNEDIETKRQMEGVEDMFAKLSAGENVNAPGRPTAEDVNRFLLKLILETWVCAEPERHLADPYNWDDCTSISVALMIVSYIFTLMVMGEPRKLKVSALVGGSLPVVV